MHIVLTARRVTIALSVMLLAGLALAEAAHALSGAAFRYSTLQTGYVMLPAAAFAVHRDTDQYNNSGGSLVAFGVGACFQTQLNLPEGAKITRAAMWYSKTNADPASASVVRIDPAIGVNAVMATMNAVNSAGAIVTKGASVTDTALQKVNNVRYGYYVSVCLSTQTNFFGVRVAYTYKTAGD